MYWRVVIAMSAGLVGSQPTCLHTVCQEMLYILDTHA